MSESNPLSHLRQLCSTKMASGDGEFWVQILTLLEESSWDLVPAEYLISHLQGQDAYREIMLLSMAKNRLWHELFLWRHHPIWEGAVTVVMGREIADHLREEWGTEPANYSRVLKRVIQILLNTEAPKDRKGLGYFLYEVLGLHLGNQRGLHLMVQSPLRENSWHRAPLPDLLLQLLPTRPRSPVQMWGDIGILQQATSLFVPRHPVFHGLWDYEDRRWR